MAMKKIVDTEERFVGYYKNYRISIAKIGDSNKYDYDISNNNTEILENIQEFPDISEAINCCKDYIDTDCNNWEKIIITQTR